MLRDGNKKGKAKVEEARMKKTLSIMLAVIMILALTACGSEKADSGYAGSYVAVEGEIAGLAMDEDSLEECSLVINDDGAAVMNTLGTDMECTWAADGTSITVSYNGTDIVGTVSGDTITFDDIFGTGQKVKFAKEGSDAANSAGSSSEE